VAVELKVVVVTVVDNEKMTFVEVDVRVDDQVVYVVVVEVKMLEEVVVVVGRAP
jgi:hypothetical protein